MLCLLGMRITASWPCYVNWAQTLAIKVSFNYSVATNGLHCTYRVGQKSVHIRSIYYTNETDVP